MVRRIFYLTTDGIWPFFNVIVLNTLLSLNRFNFLVYKYASQSNLSVLFCLISVFKCPALKFLPSPGCECWVLRKERFMVVYSNAQFLVVFPCFLCFSVSSICLPLFSWSLRVFCPFISCLCLPPDSLIVSTCIFVLRIYSLPLAGAYLGI